MRRPLLSVLLGLAVAAPASAVEYEVLFERDNWRVDVNMYDDQSLDCEARTVSDANVVFSLYEEQGGFFEIRFFSEAWSFPATETPTEFVVTVDYRSPWEMSGTRSDRSIWIRPDPEGEDLLRFLREVKNGRRLTLANAGGTALATFSLAGSAASLDVLADCADMIRQPRAADPFAGSPASAARDPFR